MKLLLILLLLNFQVFAKTVKFHAPQTEAEKALDLILNCGNFKEFDELTTKGYKKAENTMKEKALKKCDIKGCKHCICYVREFLFQLIWRGWDVDTSNMTKNEHLFYYHTHFNNDKKAIISIEPHLGDKSSYNDFTLFPKLNISDAQSLNHYRENFIIMRYNNSTWKLDGICHHNTLEINCPNPNPASLDGGRW